MKKLEGYWATNPDWVSFEGGFVTLKPDAPKEAQDSYKLYLEQCRKFDEIYGKGKWN